MRVKKFTAATVKEALAEVRREMGEKALIISTREMRGTLGRKFVEVTAASDKDEVRENPREESGERAYMPGGLEEQIVRNRVLLSQSVEPLKQELFEIRSMVDEMRRGRGNVDIEPLREEMRDLRRLFAALSRHAGIAEGMSFAAPLVDLYRELVDGEVEESLAYKLVEMLDSRLTPTEKTDPVAARSALRELISQALPTAKPIALDGNGPTVMAFIGPTGVGKTTTIAKLAARCSLQIKRKVSLITIDTYRIAAVEQLKTYARIMNIPLFVSYTPEEMRRSIAENRDSALILIDTAGRSQADGEQIIDLKNYFGGGSGIEVMLVLSATTKNRDLRDITTRFSPIDAGKLIFTKLDETTTYGSIVNEAVRTKLPIAYFTAGQNVPDDIEAASPAKLARMLLGSG